MEDIHRVSASDSHRKTSGLIASLRPICPLLIIGLALEAVYAAMLLVSRQFPSKKPVWLFLAIYGIAFLVYVLAILVVLKSKPAKAKLLTILAFSILFRLTLLPSNMMLENDIYRYLWDGAVTAHGMNPFEFAPKDVLEWPLSGEADQSLGAEGDVREEEGKKLDSLNELRDDELDSYLLKIGFPEVPTIYPPAAQMLFAASYFAARPVVKLGEWVELSWSGGGDVAFHRPALFTMKGLFVIFDLLIVFLLKDLLKRLNLNCENCIIYAWSPLVLKEFANSGHYDVFPMCMVVLALCLILCGRGILSAAFLSIGALAKLFPIVLLFPLAKRIGWKGILVFVLIFVAFYIPFMGVGLGQLFSGLGAYASRWEFNSGLFTVVEKGIFERIIDDPSAVSLFGFEQKLDAFFATKMIMGIAMLAVLIYVFRKEQADDLDTARRMFFCTGALLLLSPVMDAWYLCWIIPFLCIFPRPSWIMLTGLTVLAYTFFVRDAVPEWWVSNFEGIAWKLPFPQDIVARPLRTEAGREELYSWWMTFGIRFFEYIPFFALLLGESVWKRVVGRKHRKILTTDKEDTWQQ